MKRWNHWYTPPLLKLDHLAERSLHGFYHFLDLASGAPETRRGRAINRAFVAVLEWADRRYYANCGTWRWRFWFEVTGQGRGARHYAHATLMDQPFERRAKARAALVLAKNSRREAS